MVIFSKIIFLLSLLSMLPLQSMKIAAENKTNKSISKCDRVFHCKDDQFPSKEAQEKSDQLLSLQKIKKYFLKRPRTLRISYDLANLIL